MKTKAILVLLLCFTLYLIVAAFRSERLGSSDYTLYNNKAGKTNKVFFRFLQQKDTVYYLGDKYVTISLKEQRARLYSRKDSTIEFKISSGTDKITKGTTTPEGIYTVQSKNPQAVSKQFDDALLFNWIGFNYNIGFHGLEGSGYYHTLGIRPSSHGCVRISRESGEILYKNVKLGTPVFVYADEPARVLAFADLKSFSPERDIILKSNKGFYSKLMKNRLNNLLKGEALRKNREKVFIDGNTVMRPGGFEIGNITAIPSQQKMPLYAFETLLADKDNIKPLKYFRIKDTVTKEQKSKEKK